MAVRFDSIRVRRVVRTTTPSRPRPVSRPSGRPSRPAANTVTVPSSIDSSGGSDVSSALQSFVDGVPNGSTIVFRDGTYRLSRGIRLSGRRDLVFDGNGATLRTTGSGSDSATSPFALWGNNQRITIREFRLRGNNPTVGTGQAYHSGAENQMGILIWSGSDIDIHDVDMQGFYGDCVYVGANSTHVWSENIRIHDSSCSLIGRNAISIIAARNVTIERMSLDKLGGSFVDIEPDYSQDGAIDIMIRDNTVGSYALGERYTSWFLAAEGATGSVMRRVSVIDNRVSGPAASGYEGKPRALHITVNARGPREDFVIRGNVGTRTVAGPSMQFIGVSGLTITGNTQPLSSGSLARYTGTSGVTESGNVTTP